MSIVKIDSISRLDGNESCMTIDRDTYSASLLLSAIPIQRKGQLLIHMTYAVRLLSLHGLRTTCSIWTIHGFMPSCIVQEIS